MRNYSDDGMPHFARLAFMTQIASPATSKRSAGALTLLIVGWVLAALGLLSIAIFYITQGQFPIAAFGSWNILAGFFWIVVGAILVFVSARMPAVQPVDAGAASAHTNGLALASIIVVWFASLVGLVLGYIALSQIGRTGEQGRGMALAAVIIGWIGTAASVLIAVAFGFAYLNS